MLVLKNEKNYCFWSVGVCGPFTACIGSTAFPFVHVAFRRITPKATYQQNGNAYNTN